MLSEAYAIYRLPYDSHATLVRQSEGKPAELLSCVDLNSRRGFVMAPFEVSPAQPILVIRPDEVSRMEIPSVPVPIPASVPEASPEAGRSYYAIDFANFHAQLMQGMFRKIVLARCADDSMPAETDPQQLFYRACQLYPRMFIALVHTPQSGTWLTATPDVTWSTKNIEEQRIVATYIAECLEQFSADFSEEGPRTVRAANLVHLRSDFNFTLPTNDRIGDLLQSLHPTPAVCGLPKREAFRFIVGNEHTPRRYYSGFMGMLDPQSDTHLYVSLRCMNIDGHCCHLFAGGGLLRESTGEQEWQETEAKLETMRRLLNHK